MIAIIDYGAGNLRSIRRALETNGAETVITSDPDVVRSADAVVLPGLHLLQDLFPLGVDVLGLERQARRDLVHQVDLEADPLAAGVQERRDDLPLRRRAEEIGKRNTLITET